MNPNLINEPRASDADGWLTTLLGRSFRPWLTAWLLVFVFGIVGVWSVTLHMVHEHQEAGQAMARQQAKARVNSYGRQLEDLTNRLDQVGRALIAEWRLRREQIDFDKILVGIYPEGKPLFVSVFDPKGQLVAASFVPQSQEMGYPDVIAHHHEQCCDGWHVTPPGFSPVAGVKLVQLSHRLTSADGSFGGVLVFGMTPDFLATFEDDSVIGPRDFVTVRMIDGPVLTTKIGAGQPMRIFYKAHPRFSEPQGIRLEPGELFKDGMARYIAWRKHPSIPIVALTGVTEADAMADAEEVAQTYYLSAALVTAMLLLFCGAGLMMATKLAARREAEEEVRRVYRTATDAANEGFYMLRPLLDDAAGVVDFRFEDVNERGSELLGTGRSQLLGQSASAVLGAPLFRELLELLQRALAHHAVEEERRMPAEAGLPAGWLFRRAVKVGTGVALTLRDISDAKRHEQELLELAHRDVLTGLPNRLWLNSYLPGAIKRAQRAHRQLAILFIDLDHFKDVNDTLGHHAGDELLQEVAGTLRDMVRATDHVVRLGGDEFLILIDYVEGAAVVDQLAGAIIAGLHERFAHRDGALGKVSASIGISFYPQDGERPEELLKHADIAMYESKSRGRSQLCRYTPQLSQQLAEQLGNEQALRRALERNELVVHYQPKFRARDGKLTGVEALVRWQRPERGLVLPGSFIAMAEKTGLIVPVGERVIALVVEQFAQWRQAGLPSLRVAINVSPEQLRRTDVAGLLKTHLEANCVPAKLIDIEITESAMVEQSAAVRAQLAQMRELGMRLVIDDFGAGHSSLSQLKQLDVDVLKIDRGLIAPLEAGGDSESVCRAIIWMASALNLEVVAEGVETIEQMHVLRNMGCDELQGFLMAEPMEPASMEMLLRQPDEMRTSWLFAA